MDQPNQTLAVSLDDCPQWHGGIEHYAVWCLPVEDPAWITFIHRAQSALSPWLHPSYQRQPHITLFAAGLVDKKSNLEAMLAAQIQSLELYSLSPVLLTPSALSTFSTAPWLGLTDPNGQLNRLRSRLSQVFCEDSPPARYQPHITLGFYRETYPLAPIHTALNQLSSDALRLPPLRLDRLHLCYYRTREVQGRLWIKKTVILADRAEAPSAGAQLQQSFRGTRQVFQLAGQQADKGTG
ncbi:2'-5' RNA ligase family protein [Marinobacterium sp. AK62]|uniref:2'-5' RNA ligase family protein n=1 Tax=Marinobacterium alkalitolerans TaxID=1542925 RepID=A0ABS3Z6J9_9GAMM|nr:2'-5' RNA ligase family protein [Marinobacterium alkalitolerans]MBP0047346.1 2'-5' RNA ligase family protein [Marinobacterium alkalitolerans]